MPKTKHRRGRSRSPEDEKKRQKELVKALETPEEKRSRRIRKKEEKEKKRRTKMGWDQEMMGYTNADNPFGDQHLLDPFVWHKKREREAEEGNLSEDELEKREKKRLSEMKSELEKVKKRRLDREKEREEREEEMHLLQRMKEADMFREWENQEDTFHLEQARMRSKIRIEGGRAKPIDLLAKYINTLDNDIDIEMQEPYYLLRGLNIVDLEDLMEDMKVYLELEKDTHFDFWKDMVLICDDEIAKLRKLEQLNLGNAAGRREGIHSAVSTDVANIFKGKTYPQLVALEREISTRITSRNPGDITWWETALQQLKAHMARTRLRDRHQAVLRKKLEQLKAEQAELFGLEREEEVGGDTDSIAPPPVAMPSQPEEEEEEEEEEKEESETLIGEEDLKEIAYSAYDEGGYSPRLWKKSDLGDEVEIIDFEADEKERSDQRERILKGDKKIDDYSHLNMKRIINDEGDAEEEYDFNSEFILDPKNYVWQGKYRPRKPRFFNRVHTGFEWNKYNQTHYDTDNPPPKIVQGYKFNIFYPDLIDKMQTPTYTVTPIKTDDDFAILKFSAGPPYEDIAFKIVNREWEYSWKYGFTCQFNNNILQLWFRFKRYRYRR